MLHIGRNILSMVISRVLSGVILFLIFIKLSGYLGDEATGQFGLLASYLTVFNIFVDLGMSQYVIKKMSENRDEIPKYYSNYMTVQTILSFFFMLLMAGLVTVADYPQLVKNSLYVASVGLFLTSISLPVRSVIIANQKLTITAKVNFVNSMINAGMMILAITLRQSIFFLAFISLVISLFDLIIYTYIVKKWYALRIEFDKPFIKQLFIATVPFGLLTIVSLYNRVDGLILPHFRSFTENGYYAVAYKFWDFLAFVPSIIGISLFPYFSHSLSQNLMDRVRKGLETYTRYMIAIAVPMAVGSFLLSKELIGLYDEQFAPAAPALWILITAVAILYIYSPVNSLMISRLTKTAIKVTGFTLFFNVTLNLILIPRYGFVAAAAVTAVSELIQAMVYTYLVKKRIIEFHFFNHFVKPIIGVLFMSLAIYLLKGNSLFIILPTAIAVYGACLLVLRFFHREDWELFRAAVDVRKELNPDQTTV